MTPQLPDYTQVSRYAMFREDLGRREVWAEQTDRVVGMHLEFYGFRLDPVRSSVEHARQMHLERRALGSQRALQFGGTPILRKHARMYNCVVSHADRLRFFQELFWLLLCGCGTGFSVQRHHVAALPPIEPPTRSVKVFEIPDTIEGWADALGVLVSSYAVTDDSPFPEFRGHRVEFDARLVRPKGAPLSSGAKAPGPEPLLRALERARAVLGRAASARGFLRPIDVYDVAMHASDAVLAGGVRRSASIALFSPDDHDMATAKTGDGWWIENPQRQRSNNSAVLLRGSTSREEFARLIESTRQWGEPGFVWTDSLEAVVNPCAEITMWPVLEVDARVGAALKLPGGRVEVDVRTALAHVSGWQMCNLSTVNGREATTSARFFEACEAAAVLGTLQAGYTSFPYLGAATEAIVKREALLGVSITGMMDTPAVLFDPDVLQTGARIVVETNERLARALGINPAARATTLKPEGTTSCLLDTASGIHPHHSRRGIRHVQSASLEPPLAFFKNHNPHAVELSVQDRSGSTEVIAFPFEVGADALTKADVGALDLLEKVVLVRQNWIEPGTVVERCTRPWLRHNVSNTVHVAPDEWDAVAGFIYDNRRHLAGVALLGETADRDYEQAPFLAVYTPEERISMYGAEVVEAAARALDLWPSDEIRLWEACRRYLRAIRLTPAVYGDTEPVSERLTAFWLALDGAAVHVADVDGLAGGPDPLSKVVAAVKDEWGWRRFVELRDRSVPIDWSMMAETEDVIDHAADPACAGGQCAVPWAADFENGSPSNG